MDVFNIMSMNYKILWIKLNHLTKEATIKILNFDGTIISDVHKYTFRVYTE